MFDFYWDYFFFLISGFFVVSVKYVARTGIRPVILDDTDILRGRINSEIFRSVRWKRWKLPHSNGIISTVWGFNGFDNARVNIQS
jgi:hypothetical protein